MALRMLYKRFYSVVDVLLCFLIMPLYSSNMGFTFLVLGIPLTPMNLRLEFWVIMPSCYVIMNLHYQIIV